MNRLATFGSAIAIALLPSLNAADEGSWAAQLERMVAEGQLEAAERLASSAISNPARSAGAYEWLGRIAIAGAQHSQADARFQEALDHGGDIAHFADLWASALIKLEQRPKACAVLDEAAQTRADDASLRHRAGGCYRRLGEHRQALPHLQAAHDLGLRGASATLDLAWARFEEGREDLAVDLLDGLAESSALAPATLLEAGKMLFQRILYRQSIDPLKMAMDARPGWYEAGMYLALAHYQLEEYAASAEVLSGLEINSPPAEYRYLLGSVRARVGDPEGAHRELELGIRAAPERAAGYLNLTLFFLDQERPADAIKAFQKASLRTVRGAKILYRAASRTNCRGLSPPEDVTVGNSGLAQLLVEFGDSLLAGQQWGSALEVYRAALSINPGLARPYGGIGLICQELGTADVGLAFVSRGLELHPGDAELHYYRGSLYEYMSRLDEAIRSYQTALKSSDGPPLPARYWLRLGIAQFTAGRVEEAERSLDTAQEIDPDSAEIHYRRGKLRFAMRRYPEAESLLERAVQLNPSLAEAYYSWGLACVRNGKTEKGREILRSHRRKAALRQSQSRGM